MLKVGKRLNIRFDYAEHGKIVYQAGIFLYNELLQLYRLKVACSKQRYADVICLNHSHSGAVFFYSFPVYFDDISIFSSIQDVIFQLPFWYIY